MTLIWGCCQFPTPFTLTPSGQSKVKLIRRADMNTHWTMSGLVSKVKGRSRRPEMAWCLALDFNTRPLSPGSLVFCISSTSHLPTHKKHATSSASSHVQLLHRPKTTLQQMSWSFEFSYRVSEKCLKLFLLLFKSLVFLVVCMLN